MGRPDGAILAAIVAEALIAALSARPAVHVYDSRLCARFPASIWLRSAGRAWAVFVFRTFPDFT
jgi:hypothetical protein